MGSQAGTPVGHMLIIQAGTLAGNKLGLKAGTPVGVQFNNVTSALHPRESEMLDLCQRI
jgi:hypothetical protein